MRYCAAKQNTKQYSTRARPMPVMHEIDYRIFGNEMQYVEVELDPMEAAIAEAGGMMYMEEGIEMETIFGDGSQQSSGFLGALMGAGNPRLRMFAWRCMQRKR